MAIYHLSAKVIGRSTGRSATGAAAYRAAEVVRDDRTGLVHDFTRKGGVEHREILAPDNAPAWMRDRQALWNAVERVERRKDAQLAREVEVALPRELTAAQRLELVRDFVREEFVGRGMVADVAIHNPRSRDGEERPHAHVMLTMRCLTSEGFGSKERGWNATAMLEDWRARWADHANRALERAGRDERIDHRSYADRSVDREPQPKLGPVATAMERRGEASERGDERRAILERNAERSRLELLRAELGRQLESVRQSIVTLREQTETLATRAGTVVRKGWEGMRERIDALLGRTIDAERETGATSPGRTTEPAKIPDETRSGVDGKRTGSLPEQAPPSGPTTVERMLGRSEGKDPVVPPRAPVAVERLLGKAAEASQTTGVRDVGRLLGRTIQETDTREADGREAWKERGDGGSDRSC